MVIVFPFHILFLFSLLLNRASTTRFLPSIIWDNVNTLLCCPYNWFEVPRVDLHDIVEFVCPTSKLIVKQVNYQTRIGETMNFNLFRREWEGNVTTLKESIADGTIHSFCNVSHPDSVKLHTCRDGKYSSFPVKFTHLVFDQSKAKYEKYEKDRTYVFYSNGDGLVSSLNSKTAKCNMLFAVHTVRREQNEFGITYEKEVAPSKCKCDTSMIPTLRPTSTATPTQPSTQSSTPLPTTSERSTSSRLPNTTSTVATNNKTTTKKNINHTRLNDIQTTKPTDSNKETTDPWLTVPVFIFSVVGALVIGIVIGAIIVNKYIGRRTNSADGRVIIARKYKRQKDSSTPVGTLKKNGHEKTNGHDKRPPDSSSPHLLEEVRHEITNGGDKRLPNSSSPHTWTELRTLPSFTKHRTGCF